MPVIPPLSTVTSLLERAKTLRDVANKDLLKVESDIKRLDGESISLIAVEAFIRRLIEQEVTTGVQAVEQLQTEGLQAVFNDQNIRVKSETEIQRGKVSVDMITVQTDADGSEVEGSPNDAFGGSVLTVQSVLMRLIIMTRWGLRPMLILDESLPAFDSNYVINMGRFLSTLCKRLGMDILLVSHDPAMVEAADKAYRISKVDGHAKFEVTR